MNFTTLVEACSIQQIFSQYRRLASSADLRWKIENSSTIRGLIGQRKNSPRKSWTVPTLLLVASREQVRQVENVILVIVILLSVKYLSKPMVKTQWFPLFLPVTYDVIDECFHIRVTNVFTISCLSIEPPPASVNLVLQHGAKPWKVSIALFVDYSRTIRTIRGLFVLFFAYSRTIRTIRWLFADYSYYSSTIRTIRFTILFNCHFARLYYPHFTTFCNEFETLEYY
jgi:hypothetical protein